MNGKIKPLAVSLVLALLLLSSAFALLCAEDGGPPPVLAAAQAAGGPDDFGYVYTDSQTTPALYNWVDIAAGGTPVGFSDPDTAVRQLDLPDTFTFYGDEHNRLYVTTNGYASFHTVYTSDVVTQCHPAERQPSDSVAALCTDLVGDTTYYSTTTAYNGHETFIIQYDSVTHTHSGLTTTFQIILDVEDDAIIYQYHALPASPGVTTTVGIIGYATNQEDYLTYCQGDAGCPPQEGLAVRFSLSPPPLLGLTLTPNDHFCDVGDMLTYTLVLSNSGALAPGAVLTNALPAGLDYVSGTLQATGGAPTYQAAARTLHWTGDLTTDVPVTLTYAAMLNTGDAIYNRARLGHPLARRDATAVSSPAEPWEDPGPLDAPHKFDHRLGTWRHIAVDDAGTLHVAYAGTGLYHATLSGTTWLSETVPGTVPNLRHAALTLDDQNRALIAFYGQERLWLARQTDTGWTVEEIAEIGWIGTNFALDLARGSDGHPHLVYNGRGYTTDELHYTAHDGADWLTPTVAIPSPDCYAYDAGFSLALDADDVPHIACTYRGSIPRELRVYTYTAAAPWTGYTTVVSGSNLYYYPSLAFDGTTPHLAFYQGFRALYHAAHDGTDWQATLVDDSAPTSYLRRGAALDIGGGQVGILGTLRAGSSGNYTLTVHYAARSLTETTWVTGTALTLTYSGNDPRPTLALDGAGQAHLAYYDSRDQTLRYAAEAEGFAPTMADESRSLGAAAVALGVDGAIHVAWASKGLRYAVGAADTLTWTRQMAVSEPEVSHSALALAVDGADTAHLLYGERDTPLYHATPATDSTWITRVVDLPGDVKGFDIGAEMTGTAHVAYLAVQGSEHVLRHAAFDGATWLTETLATVSPATWNHDQTPQIVAQGGQVYVLYGDCTQNPDDGSDYPIALRLATGDGVAWAHETLYEFIGQCNWQLTYRLAGDAEGRLSAVAHINGDSVRPRPLVVTFWIADAAGQRQVTQQSLSASSIAPGAVQPTGAQAPTMMSYIIQAMLRGEGGMATWIEYGTRIIQQWDREGNLSGKIPEETGSSSVAVEDGIGDGERSVVVERWEHENELRVPRSVRRPPCDECCLNAQVQPAEAAAAGCTAAPAHTQGACGAQVEVTASGCDGWKFTHWSGAATGSNATTLADMTGTAPDCSVATAHFAEETATALKTAEIWGVTPITATSKEVVYPNDIVAYSVKLSWKGPAEAVISLTDEYPRPRVDYIQGTVEMGPWIHGCAVADSITCNGRFPPSEEGVSTYVAFETVATCDLYRTEDPAGPLVNLASVQIGDYQFQPQVNNDVAVPFLLKSSTPYFMPQSAFAPGHNVLLYTIPKGDEPDCCTACALDVYVVVDGDTDNPHLMKNDGAGLNDRAQADFIANDCHHALWFEPTENRAYRLDLYVVKRGEPFESYYLADTLTLEPAATPELAVYTDLRELFKEFNETQANSPSNDDNGNCIRDYYDALARMVRYADDHDGVLIDVRQDAYTTDHDFRPVENFAIRRQMGQEIDQNVTANLEEFRLGLFNIAIIGDDTVVPFYRMETPAGAITESDYFAGNAAGNPTLLDTQNVSGGAAKGHFMSDLPYATYETTLPNYPRPSISIGRIYYQTPQQLISAIDGYEQPINIRAASTSAAATYIANADGLQCVDMVERSIVPVLRNRYGTGLQANVVYTAPATFQNGRAYLYSGNTTPWNTITTTRRALQNTHIGVIYAHADHTGWDPEALRRGVAGARSIVNTDLSIANTDVFISIGCHSGYNPAFQQNNAAHPHYRQNLVRGMLDRHVAYYAPTVYGLADNNVIAYHDLLNHNFLKGLFSRYYDKLGDAYYIALARYRSQGVGEQDIDKYVIYSGHLFGLPTQPLQRTESVALHVEGVASRHPSLAAASAIDGVIDSEFEVRFDGEGRAVFEVAGGGRVAEPFGPVLPAVHRSYLLPADAMNIAVTLVTSDSHPYTGTVEPQFSVPVCFSFGPLTGTFTTTTGLYPAQLISHTIYPDAGGLHLDLTATPLRYDFDTGAVTLYDRLAYRITYDSTTTASVSDLKVNNGNQVVIGAIGVPVTLTLQTTSPLSGTLVWSIEDGAGGRVTDDVAALNVGAGTSEVTWQIDTEDWQPGTKQLWVAVRDAEEKVVAAGSTTFDVIEGSLAIYLPLIMRE